MITVKRIPFEKWEEYETHPDIYLSGDYDVGQFGDRYEFYQIVDMAYWDALVAYDRSEKKAVGILSQVIGLERATELINDFLAKNLRYLKSLPLSELRKRQDILQKQQQLAYKQKNSAAMENLIMMESQLIEAVASSLEKGNRGGEKG